MLNHERSGKRFVSVKADRLPAAPLYIGIIASQKMIFKMFSYMKQLLSTGRNIHELPERS